MPSSVLHQICIPFEEGFRKYMYQGHYIARELIVEIREHSVTLDIHYDQAYVPGKKYVPELGIISSDFVRMNGYDYPPEVKFRPVYKHLLVASFKGPKFVLYEVFGGYVRNAITLFNGRATVLLSKKLNRNWSFEVPQEFYLATIWMAMAHGYDMRGIEMLKPSPRDLQKLVYPILKDMSHMMVAMGDGKYLRKMRTPADWCQHVLGTRHRRVVRYAQTSSTVVAYWLRQVFVNDDLFANALEALPRDDVRDNVVVAHLHHTIDADAVVGLLRQMPQTRIMAMLPHGDMHLLRDMAAWYMDYPGLSLDGFTTFGAMHDAWAHEIMQRRNVGRQKELAQPIPYLEEYEELDGASITDELQFKLFADGNEMLAAGELMHNCIGTYVQDVKIGRTVCCYVNKKGSMYANLEINNGQLHQLVKRFNERLPEDEKDVIVAWLYKNKLIRSVGGYYV